MKYKVFFLSIFISTAIHANMMKDMALMVGAQVGATQANKDITNEFSNTFNDIQQEQTNLNNDTNYFFTSTSEAQKNLMSNISSIFQTARKQVSIIQDKQSKEAESTQSYIQSVTSLQVPAQNYLDNPILYDQLFANGTMYTPQTRAWKNIFQIGDWEFDEETSSFWQYEAIPFTSTTDQHQDAFKNFIFTEWNTHKSYEIFCDITLYKVSYPFYVGIIFNKARWISGDTYGLEKYRTLGIYARNNKKVSLCFAQSVMQSSKKKNSSKEQFITPLEQISQNQGVQNFTINQMAFQNLSTKPITFHIKIKPTPNSVAYKIWDHGSAEPSEYTNINTGTIISNTISNKKNKSKKYPAANYNDLFLYHGVGFLSPGAIAQFNLKGPQELLFSQNNIDNFKNEISNYFKDQQYKFTSRQLESSTTKGV
ncbi:hypothetical protein HYV10_01845 [Candidatus Dependentiae bacterium]|nr:hypothetical protein [Candidatus Dependentiae bacterium]